MNISSADAVILNAVQNDARIQLETLAELSGLSISSIQRRLKRFRQDGLITKDVTLLDPAKVGQPMSFIIMVEMERERLEQLDAFHRAAAEEPQVQQCYYVTGEADFCLICTASDMADFEALTHRLFFGNSNVRRFRTSVVMKRNKVSLSVKVSP